MSDGLAVQLVPQLQLPEIAKYFGVHRIGMSILSKNTSRRSSTTVFVHSCLLLLPFWTAAHLGCIDMTPLRYKLGMQEHLMNMCTVGEVTGRDFEV